jgi:hypothetical protein
MENNIFSVNSRQGLGRRLLMFAMFLVAAIGIASAQGRTVKGSVVDGFGDPIIGANVLVVGTTNGAISDLDGNFTLQNVAQNAKLQVSYIGYLTQTVAVNGQSSIKITLKEDSKALDEVVVVGYGTMKKSDLTGAMARVSSKQIEERSVQNALQAMQGKAAGVDVASNNRPGELA